MSISQYNNQIQAKISQIFPKKKKVTKSSKVQDHQHAFKIGNITKKNPKNKYLEVEFNYKKFQETSPTCIEQ